ncbi:ankyrin repeat domain-containing protein 34A-like isoform X2 [Eriocheir sinensis]|uniref:ankyrin repeat domain-containing protein 34A-like isoform X2 n=1 Tax=Eriocheir sinensis TaxID=95602 RepID=UPI0021C6B2BF|nr:ankyrin repeat domain-containing protein 34A-like isoform X2 [Eriocheir sinensis]
MGGGQWAGGGNVGGLVEAVRQGRLRHVQLLLEAGVEVNGQDETGTRPLVAAVTGWRGEDAVQERVMRDLLKAGADANLGDARGTTPLMHAAAHNLTRVALTLLQHEGVDPGVQDGDGNSALMYAAAHGHHEALLLVLAAFRSLHRATCHAQKNAQGLTAWQLAERNGHEDLATLLKEEAGPFPRPRTFLLPRPQDLLDRPPTPTEPRSSHKRTRVPASSQPPSRGGPTDPLPPPAFFAFGQAVGSAAPTSSDSESEGARPPTGGQRLLTATPTEKWPPGHVREGVWGAAEDARLSSSGSDRGESREDSSSQSSSAGGAGPPSPLHVPPPDEEERRVLDRLMTGSPGSGNEGDTESLMELDRSAGATMTMAASEEGASRVATGRKVGVMGPVGGMPRLNTGSCSRSLNRSIAALVQEDAQQRPDQRPPTPARPSLPNLLPARLLDAPLTASLGSSRLESRPPQRRITLASFPRSSSEPRSLLSSTAVVAPHPHDGAYDGIPLDASTRSEGWEALRGARSRQQPFPHPSDGHVVPLPPINGPRYLESGARGRAGGRTRGASGEEAGDVLSVAKKTLEQLENVLAPHEGFAATRPLPRTRTSHQIHLET